MTNGPINFEDAIIGQDGVIVKVPLTVQPTASDFNAATDNSVITTTTFDSAGMTLAGSDRLQFSDMTSPDSGLWLGLGDEGQIGFDVLASKFCVEDVARGSNGDTPDGAQTEWSLIGVEGATNGPFRLRRTPSVGWRSSVGNGDLARTDLNAFDGSGSATSALITTIGKDAYVRAVFTWFNNAGTLDMSLAVNGVRLLEGSAAAFGFEELTDNIWIGNRSVAVGTSSVGVPIKNLIISKERAEWNSTKIPLIFGDSQVRTSDHDNPANGYDEQPMFSYLYEAAANRDYVETSNVILSQNSSKRIEATDGTQLPSLLPAELAKNPTDVYPIWGTNDAINATLDPVQMESDLDDMITSIMNTPSVTGVIHQSNVMSFVGNTAQDTQANRDRRDNIVNPILASKTIGAIDAFNHLGAENPAPFTFIGQQTGSFTDFHVFSLGGRLLGSALYNGEPIITPASQGMKLFRQMRNSPNLSPNYKTRGAGTGSGNGSIKHRSPTVKIR